MAKRRRGRAARSTARHEPSIDDEQPIDLVQIGQGVGTFETINGLPQSFVAAGLTVVAILLLRPIIRGLRAFIRG